MNNMKQAVSYTRFSSGRQARGSSTERQRAMVSLWLEAHPEYTLSSLSADDKGISGFRGKHLEHGLGEIIEAISKQLIRPGDILLIEAIDRLGRMKPLEMLPLVQRIVGAGVDICTLDDGQLYDQESVNNNALFMLVGKVQQAHQYSEQLSRRVKASYTSRRARTLEGKRVKRINPLWLDNFGHIKPYEAGIVNKAIEWYLQGQGTRQIVIKLREQHPELLTLNPSTIKRWLQNPALIGKFVLNGEELGETLDALISPTVFYRLQGELERRSIKPGPSDKHSLSGIVFCSVCDSRFHTRKQKPRPTLLAPLGSEEYLAKPTILYCNCKTYLQTGACQNNSTWPYEVLEYILTKSATECIVSIAQGMALDTKDQDLSDANERLRYLEKMISIKSDLYEVTLDKKHLAQIEDLVAQKNLVREDIELISSSITNTSHQSAVIVNYEEIIAQQDNFNIITQQQIDRIDKLPKEAVVDLLKKHGLKIRIRSKEASCTYGHTTYRLIRRSQKYSCYILEEEQEDSDLKYVAIFRNITSISANSEEQLLVKLAFDKKQ